MRIPRRVHCAFCIIAIGSSVGWLTSLGWAQSPETGAAVKPLHGGIPLDPLGGAREKPILIEPWELPPLPPTMTDPAMPRNPPATEAVLPTNKSLRVPLANSIYLFGQVQN